MEVPLSEQDLRAFARNPSGLLPSFTDEIDTNAITKHLNHASDLVLGTADVVDLAPTHRTAACNAACALIEACQSSASTEVRNAVLEDLIWLRLLHIYLERSDDAKGKSMRQMLLTLTGALLKHDGERSEQLRDRAATTFLEIICRRQDRVKVKPALQGLAHFLQKNVVSLERLIELYQRMVPNLQEDLEVRRVIDQEIFIAFLSWVVHHDTALSAGHLIKNFLTAHRRSYSPAARMNPIDALPLWVIPVVEMLQDWKDRLQEFKTHVFPYCFQPNIQEFTSFLSYLHFQRYISTVDPLPEQLTVKHELQSDLTDLEEFKLLLAALQTGKELGLVRDVDCQEQPGITIDSDVIVLPDDIFDAWISDPEPYVRLSGLFLSVYSTGVTRPVSAGILKSIRHALVHLNTETDANSRKELLNHSQRLIERIKGSTVAQVKGKPGKSSQHLGRVAFTKDLSNGQKVLTVRPDDSLAEPLGFVLWYAQFLSWELRCTASYQRRATALRSLTVMLKSGLDASVPHHHLSKSAQGQLRWAHGLDLIDEQLIRTLFDLVFDAFDDIRAGAASLLQLCMDSLDGFKKSAALLKLSRFIHRGETMMLRTGRADQADGVARAYSLLFSQCSQDTDTILVNDQSHTWTKTYVLESLVKQLEETLEFAKSDLSGAVDGRPVHGIFASLRYIIDQDSFYQGPFDPTSSETQSLKHVHGRILNCYRDLWACIKDVLCADAPEGHVPDEIEEEASLDTKEILSYSWRGLKEASTLLRAIIVRGPIGDDETSLVSSETAASYGRLCFTQLVDLRHRGAFATVAQTFAAFCRRCVVSTDSFLSSLPKQWYKDTMLCIQDKAGAITRRSAGIPSLITGIVSADQPDGRMLGIAMKDLFEEASLPAQSTNIEQSRLPQVHALNSIKEIFTSSKLSAASEPYIGQGLDLAAKTLNSHIWPIRNCSLMLFKALIERLLGSDEAQDWDDHDRTKTSRFSYQNYPSLVDILVTLLDPTGPLQQSMTSTTDNTPMDLHGAEGVFPALQILRQASPPESHKETIIRSVMYLLGSPHWHLRDMAARTLVSLKESQDYKDTILTLIKFHDCPFNEQHGRLLAIKHLLAKYLQVEAFSSGCDEEVLASLRAKADAVVPEAVTEDKRSHSYLMISAAFDDLINMCGEAMISSSSHSITTVSAWNDIMALDQARLRMGYYEHLELFFRPFARRWVIHDAFERSKTTSASDTNGLVSLLDSWWEEAGCAALETIARVFHTTASRSYRVLLLVDVSRLILKSYKDDVKARARLVLVEAFEDERLRRDLLATLTERNVVMMVRELGIACLRTPPAHSLPALSLLGYFLDYAYAQWGHIDHELSSTEPGSVDSPYPDNIFHEPPCGESQLICKQNLVVFTAKYIRLLRRRIVDTNPFDVRMAATKFLAGFDRLFGADTADKDIGNLILSIAMVLYDMLVDDDDEIRDLAASTADRLLRAQGYMKKARPAVPLVMVQRLAGFLAARFPANKDLAKESLRRLVGVQTSRELFSEPFANTLATARKEDTALFSKEKQNLFKDDSMDASIWANVLKRLSPEGSTKNQKAGMVQWVLDGILSLTQVSKTELDGPLGWSTKVEVFTLGMRVICVANVCLVWRCPRTSEIRHALREFVDAARESEVNGLWLQKAERVLESSVVDVLRLVKGTLTELHTDT